MFRQAFRSAVSLLLLYSKSKVNLRSSWTALFIVTDTLNIPRITRTSPYRCGSTPCSWPDARALSLTGRTDKAGARCERVPACGLHEGHARHAAVWILPRRVPDPQPAWRTAREDEDV